jgi:hypothetical protein
MLSDIYDECLMLNVIYSERHYAECSCAVSLYCVVYGKCHYAESSEQIAVMLSAMPLC